MARRGARLFLTDINADPLETVVREIEQEGGGVALDRDAT